MIFLLHVEWPEMPPYKLLLTYYVWRIVWRHAVASCCNVFYYVYKRFLSRFFYVFNVFYFYLNVFYIYAGTIIGANIPGIGDNRYANSRR